jgi:signal transduction histidine kinase
MDTSTTDKHLGPLVMRERVEMAGGVFSISSSPERGTTVRAEIPLEEATRD